MELAAAIVLSLAVTGLLIVAVRLEKRSRSPFVLLWLVLLLIYALPSFSDAFATHLAFSDTHVPVALWEGNTLLRAHLFAIGFLSLYIATKSRLAARCSDDPLTSARVPGDDSNTNTAVVQIYLIVMLGGVGAAMLAGAIVGLHQTDYETFRREGPLFWLLFAYTSAATSGLVFYLCLSRRFLLAAALTLLIAVAALSVGVARQLLLPLFVPFLLYAILRIRRYGGWLLLGAALLVASALVTFLGVFRSHGAWTAAVPAMLGRDFWRILIEHLLSPGMVTFGEMTVRIPYYFFFQPDVELPGFGQARTLIRLLLFFVPTSLAAGLKPRDFDETLYVTFYSLDESAPGSAGTLHISFFGHIYVNFGWLGIASAPAFALAFHGLTRFAQRQHRIVGICLYGALGYGALMLGRGSFYNTVMQVIPGFILAVAIGLALSRSRFRSLLHHVPKTLVLVVVSTLATATSITVWHRHVAASRISAMHEELRQSPVPFSLTSNLVGWTVNKRTLVSDVGETLALRSRARRHEYVWISDLIPLSPGSAYEVRYDIDISEGSAGFVVTDQALRRWIASGSILSRNGHFRFVTNDNSVYILLANVRPTPVEIKLSRLDVVRLPKAYPDTVTVERPYRLDATGDNWIAAFDTIEARRSDTGLLLRSRAGKDAGVLFADPVRLEAGRDYVVQYDLTVAQGRLGIGVQEASGTWAAAKVAGQGRGRLRFRPDSSGPATVVLYNASDAPVEAAIAHLELTPLTLPRGIAYALSLDAANWDIPNPETSVIADEGSLLVNSVVRSYGYVLVSEPFHPAVEEQFTARLDIEVTRGSPFLGVVDMQAGRWVANPRAVRSGANQLQFTATPGPTRIVLFNGDETPVTARIFALTVTKD